jgi:hypothetical protein
VGGAWGVVRPYRRLDARLATSFIQRVVARLAWVRALDAIAARVIDGNAAWLSVGRIPGLCLGRSLCDGERSDQQECGRREAVSEVRLFFHVRAP